LKVAKYFLKVANYFFKLSKYFYIRGKKDKTKEQKRYSKGSKFFPHAVAAENPLREKVLRAEGESYRMLPKMKNAPLAS
jgi:hypothetical protein